MALIVAFQGLLMVSSVPFRSFKDLRKNMKARFMLASGLTACLVGAIALDPSMWFGVGALGYIALGTLDGTVTWLHFRNRPSDAPPEAVDDLDADVDIDEATAEDPGLLLASDER